MNALASFLLNGQAQYDGLGKQIPADIKSSPDKIAELLGASHQVERRPVYFKSPDGSFHRAEGREVLVKPDSIFTRLTKELATNGLEIGYGTTVKSTNTVVVCSPLADTYNFSVGKGDTLRLYLNTIADYNPSHPMRANLVVMRESNAATLSLNPTVEQSIADVMKGLAATIKETKQAFEFFNKTAISARELEKYFSAVIGIDSKDIGKKDRTGSKLISTKTENILKMLNESYSNAPGSEVGRGTVWGALQAVCYYATHLKTVRDTSGAGVLLARSASNLIGDADKLKTKAMDLALGLATRPARNAA
jgi:Domain of unknown function (DUF932)